MATLRRSDVIKVVKDWKDGKLQNEYVTQELNSISNNKIWYHNQTSKEMDENSLAYVEKVSFDNRHYEDAYREYADGHFYIDLRECDEKDDPQRFILVPKRISPHTCIIVPDWSVFIATVLLKDENKTYAKSFVAKESRLYPFLPPTFVTTKEDEAEYVVLGTSEPPRKSIMARCVMALLKPLNSGSLGGGVKIAIIEKTTSVTTDKKLTVKVGDESIEVISPLSSEDDIFDKGKKILIAKSNESDEWIVVNAEC